MNLRRHRLLAAALIVFLAPSRFLHAADPATPPSYVPQQAGATITLGYGYLATFAPVAPDPPVQVIPGAAVKLITGHPGGPYAGTFWFKDGVSLGDPRDSWEIAAATPADSGVYTADVRLSGVIIYCHPLTLRVGVPIRQPMLNFSSRGTIGPANPALIGGFVIAASPGSLNEAKTVLIRAVGPTLADYKVPHPLADPRVQLFDDHGAPVNIPNIVIPETPSPALVARRVGAFPLRDHSTDFAAVAVLPAGGYTAHVVSASGGSGDVLLEIYDVPDSALWPWY